MKGRNLILMALITLIAGALMLVYRNALASHGIVIGCGILFILAGVANMTVFLGERDKDGRARMSAAGTALGWVASAAAVVLGVVMLLFRTVFEAMVGYMFAILLLFVVTETVLFQQKIFLIVLILDILTNLFSYL